MQIWKEAMAVQGMLDLLNGFRIYKEIQVCKILSKYEVFTHINEFYISTKILF